MTEPRTRAGRWLVDRSQWDSGLRAFRVRINATAGPEDMLHHVLAIEAEASTPLREALEESAPTDLQCGWCGNVFTHDCPDNWPAILKGAGNPPSPCRHGTPDGQHCQPCHDFLADLALKGGTE